MTNHTPYLSNSAINTLNNAAWPQPGNISIAGANPTISTEKNSINLDELADMIKIMRDRFLILAPVFEQHEKYEALKKAYDHYKMIEALMLEDKHV